MKKIYFIANLVAGKAVISEKLGNIINEFNKAGYEVTVHVTQNSSDAEKRTAYACSREYDLIVCAGGDGTLSQCLHGIMKSPKKLPIGYIPAGSTNDFAKSLGIPRNTMSAVRRIISGSPRTIDIGACNDRYFTYVAAFGAFINVTYETPQNIKNVLGHLAYILNGMAQLPSLKARKLRIEHDGEVIEGEFLFGMVSNTKSVAGILSMKDFRLDDGEFEVILIRKPTDIVQLLMIVHRLLHISENIDCEYIRFFCTKEITFTNLESEKLPWTLDGEFGGDDKVVKISCLNKAASFVTGGRRRRKIARIIKR